MNFYKRKRRMPTVIIVSLIDIFAILLIFVIVTTTFKRAQPTVVIKLPEVGGSSGGQARGAEPVLLTVAPDEAIYLDNARVTLEKLEPALRRVVAEGRRVALNADRKAPFGVVLRVLETLKRAGVAGSVPAFTETIKKGS